MALLDRQRRGVQLGALRMGVRVVKNGKERPEKLTTWRLTSPDSAKIEAAAALYGGEVKPWTPQGQAPQWEVVTNVATLPVRIPPGDSVQQDYMRFSPSGRGVVRDRLCDGFREALTGHACLCPVDLLERKRMAATGTACKPTTRLSVVLADLPGLGVWQLTSTGDSAADELAATAELLSRTAAQGIMLPASLRIEQRRNVGAGEVRQYVVPVLDVAASLAALESGVMPTASLEQRAQAALPAAAPRALEGTVEPALPSQPVDAQTVADRAAQATDVDVVKRLGGWARERGWLTTFVKSGDVEEPLENVLYAHLERVGGLG